MVRPSSDWDETESGYKKRNTRVDVESVRVYADDRMMSVSTVGRGDENAYAVVCLRGTPGYEHHDTIARFADERTAWEFANLLTRYIDEVHGPDNAIMTFNDPRIDGSEAEALPPVVDDMDAETALRTKLGLYEFQVSNILDG